MTIETLLNTTMQNHHLDTASVNAGSVDLLARALREAWADHERTDQIGDEHLCAENNRVFDRIQALNEAIMSTTPATLADAAHVIAAAAERVGNVRDGALPDTVAKFLEPAEIALNRTLALVMRMAGVASQDICPDRFRPDDRDYLIAHKEHDMRTQTVDPTCQPKRAEWGKRHILALGRVLRDAHGTIVAHDLPGKGPDDTGHRADDQLGALEQAIMHGNPETLTEVAHVLVAALHTIGFMIDCEPGDPDVENDTLATVYGGLLASLGMLMQTTGAKPEDLTVERLTIRDRKKLGDTREEVTSWRDS